MKLKRALLLSVLFFVACGGQEVQVDTDIEIPVSVKEIKPKSIEEFVLATGTVNAVKEVLLTSETSGFYQVLKNPQTGRPFALGDAVKAGQEIIHLDNPELENSAKIESQELNLDISEREYEKQKSLYEKGGVTLRELKNAERSYIDAKYNYENARIQLGKLRITAPFDGVIVELPYYTVGTKVATNSPMVKIMDYTELYMEVHLPGKEMDRIKVGQPVRVMNYALPEDTLKGNMDQISPTLDPDTRTFKASLQIANPERRLRPGMFAKAEIVVAQADNAIVIPKDIILSKRRGKTVFVVERGTAQERVLTTGLENPSEVEVVRGLQPDERLVIKGFETLQNRSKVKIIR